MDGLTIRPAERADVPILLGLMKDQAAFEKMADQMVATEADYEAALFGEQPCAEAVIAEGPIAEEREKTALLGVAIFYQNFSTFTGGRGLYLEDIHVVPKARRRGIGRALLRHLAALAQDRGCRRFEWVVLDWNQSAVEFYEDLGAKVLPDWRIVRAEGAAIDKIASWANENST